MENQKERLTVEVVQGSLDWIEDAAHCLADDWNETDANSLAFAYATLANEIRTSPETAALACEAQAKHYRNGGSFNKNEDAEVEDDA